MAKKIGHQKVMQMGLGEAINRLVKVNTMLSSGVASIPEDTLTEREMIIEALDQFKLDLSFDCNTDGVPDTVAIFEQSASTSCCRILPFETDRRKPAAKKRKTESRRKTVKKASKKKAKK